MHFVFHDVCSISSSRFYSAIYKLLGVLFAKEVFFYHLLATNINATSKNALGLQVARLD